MKARGHPVGATGVAQVVDIVWQLRHELPKNRQVKNAQNGLTVNFGGFGNNVLCLCAEEGRAMKKEIAITAYKCKKCGKLHYPYPRPLPGMQRPRVRAGQAGGQCQAADLHARSSTCRGASTSAT